MPEPAETGEDAMDAVVSGGIAKVVAKEAVAKIPGSLQFRLRILEVLRRFSSQAGVDSIVQDLLTGIEVSTRLDDSASLISAHSRQCSTLRGPRTRSCSSSSSTHLKSWQSLSFTEEQ